jgi:cell wall-associated NlpC family hydrolase
VKTLIEYAKSFIGMPYIWGAEGVTGFDCSGLVQEILRSIGEDPKGDQTAQELYRIFSKEGDKSEKCQAGALCFYGKSLSFITHVAFGIDNFRVVEAGGGDSTCVDLHSAAKRSAMVRIRPHNHRSDLVAMVMPEYINCKKEI